jgi:hypothetical protein
MQSFSTLRSHEREPKSRGCGDSIAHGMAKEDCPNQFFAEPCLDAMQANAGWVWLRMQFLLKFEVVGDFPTRLGWQLLASDDSRKS